MKPMNLGQWEALEDLAQRTAKFKETMRETVLGYSALVLTTLQEELDKIRRPDEIKLEFGLQVGGEAGIVFISKGTVNANVRVTLEWNLKKEKE